MVRIFGVSAALSVLGLLLSLVLGGPKVLAVVAILAVLEVSLSFDNAVVNAGVLERLTPVWQQRFLTYGIVIAVFGMRLVFPLLVVGVSGHLGPAKVVDLALNDPAEYARTLTSAGPAISAFGGMFLLMIFLDFFVEEREERWLHRIETAAHKAGRVPFITIVIGIATLVASAKAFAGGHQTQVLVSGALGLATYIVVNGLSRAFAGARDVAHAGLMGFLYLQVLDASFSFDGVIGAFAVSNKIFEIAAGLGIGALWVRSATIYLVRHGTLARYAYLEHGAHYAIGALAVVLFVSIRHEVPELVTGLIGIGFIAMALLSSVRRRA